MEYIIETKGLTKQYPNKLAADNINMHIKKGDIYGLIGKNGAGKTTTMKMILGMNFPTSGSIQLFGSDNLDQGRSKIGSLIESPGLYMNYTAYENLKAFSLIYGGTEEEIQEILNIIGLNNTGKRKAKAFSLGMRQRLGIGIALLGNPEILVLDEPINGLDPSAIKDVRDTLLRLNQEKGTTILISSHLLDELAKITTCYGIINQGRLIEEIDADALMERCKQGLMITVNNVDQTIAVLQNNYADIEYKVKDHTITLYTHFDHPEQINQLLVTNHIEVSELKFNEDGFENYFIERIGK